MGQFLVINTILLLAGAVIWNSRDWLNVIIKLFLFGQGITSLVLALNYYGFVFRK